MRIKALRNEYVLADLSSYILGAMRTKKINQSEMAEALNMTQGNLSQKLKKNTLTARDLVIIFDKLGTPAEKVGEILGGSK